jgi:hypothetical protein
VARFRRVTVGVGAPARRAVSPAWRLTGPTDERLGESDVSFSGGERILVKHEPPLIGGGRNSVRGSRRRHGDENTAVGRVDFAAIRHAQRTYD